MRRKREFSYISFKVEVLIFSPKMEGLVKLGHVVLKKGVSLIFIFCDPSQYYVIFLCMCLAHLLIIYTSFPGKT